MHTISYMNYKSNILMTLIPFICCTVLLLFSDISYNELYIPADTNPVYNDGLVYYQMVNTDLSKSEVKGYFGWNESHAEIGNHYAWSPARQINWTILGWLFGWNIESPWIYNIIMVSIGFLVYSLLTKPSIGQTLRLMTMLMVFTCFGSNILSSMSEVSALTYIIIYLGLTKRIIDRDEMTFSDVVLSNVIIFVLFLMRPYFLSLVVIEYYYMYRYRKKKELITTLVLSIPIYLVSYTLFNLKMTSQINGHTVGALSSDSSLLEDIKLNIHALLSSLKSIISLFRQVIVDNSGSLHIVYQLSILFSVILFFISLYFIYKAKNSNYKQWYMLWMLVLLIVFVGTMTKLGFNIACRHNFYASVVMIFLVANDENEISRQSRVLVLIIMCYVTLQGLRSGAVLLPAYDPDKEYELYVIKDILDYNKDISDEWSRTIDWVLDDEYGNTDYTYLYGLPDDIGINICESQYVRDNLQSLKSEYIYAFKGGDIESLLIENGKELLYSNDDICIYRLH